MQLKQLRNFITVVHEGSFSRAAKELYTAQSSLSQSVANLEKELGFPLLLRGHDGVTPTQFGQMVYEDAVQVLSQLDGRAGRWKEYIREHTSLRGSVRLSSVSSVHPIVERLILPQLGHTWPNLRCSLQEARSDTLLSLLWQGRADLALYTFPDSGRAQLEQTALAHNLEVLPLRGDTYRIAVSAKGPLGQKQALSPADAASLPLACYAGVDEVAAVFFERYFDRSLALEFNSFEKMVDAALSGRAGAVLPAMTTQTALALTTHSSPLRFLTVDGFFVPFTHYLISRRDSRGLPGMEQVRQTVQSVFDRLGTQLP